MSPKGRERGMTSNSKVIGHKTEEIYTPKFWWDGDGNVCLKVSLLPCGQDFQVGVKRSKRSKERSQIWSRQEAGR